MGLSIFANTKGDLTEKSGTGRQSCEIPAMMHTRKPADCVQRLAKVQFLYKEVIP